MSVPADTATLPYQAHAPLAGDVAVPSPRQRRAARLLQLTAACWLGSAVFGQLLFATFILGFYGVALLQGRVQDWNKVLPHGYVAGETFGNLVIGAHLLFATVVILGGALQLLPWARRRWPALHRWNGRFYLLAATLVSLAGLDMLLTHGAVGDLSQHLALGLNAVLIMVFAGITWHHARQGAYAAHRRWALRTFLVVSGVWFFRVGLLFWIVVNQGPVGFDAKSFTGPFLTFLAFAQYLLPLAVLELYLRAQRSSSARLQMATATTLGVLTLAMLLGIGAVAALMWWPRLQA